MDVSEFTDYIIFYSHRQLSNKKTVLLQPA